jgi:hypothetical protein
MLRGVAREATESREELPKAAQGDPRIIPCYSPTRVESNGVRKTQILPDALMRTVCVSPQGRKGRITHLLDPAVVHHVSQLEEHALQHHVRDESSVTCVLHNGGLDLAALDTTFLAPPPGPTPAASIPASSPARLLRRWHAGPVMPELHVGRFGPKLYSPKLYSPKLYHRWCDRSIHDGTVGTLPTGGPLW